MRRWLTLTLVINMIWITGCLISKNPVRAQETETVNLVPFTPEAEDSASPRADVTMYGAGQGKISFSPQPPAEVGYSLHLKGNSSFSVLMFRITKGGSERSLVLWNDSKDFDRYYVFKDGPGVYEITVFGTTSRASLRYQGLAQFSVKVTKNPPEGLTAYAINNKIMDFVNQNMGKSIGRGECWDVAQEALDKNGADWKRTTLYGIRLDPQKDEILPGDIIQFRQVKLVSTLPNGGTRTEWLGMPDHTAVVYEVLEKLHYKLAHQNVDGKRYIVVTELNLNNMVSGGVAFYRPIAGLIEK